MPTLDYRIYDTIDFGTTANSDHVAFQARQGSSAGGGKQLTNMRGNGEFPSRESFVCNWIGFTINDILSADDIKALFFGSVLTFTLNSSIVLQEPLANFSYRNAVGGFNNMTAAATLFNAGIFGDGRMLDPVIEIPGGVGFDVTVTQGVAVDSADLAMFLQLGGLLTIPDN